MIFNINPRDDPDLGIFVMTCLLASLRDISHPGVIRTALGPGDMDREQREHYQVVIEAKDMAGQRGGLTGTTAVNITLTDVNDNPPRFTQSIYQFRVPESAKSGTSVGRIVATDRDIGKNAEMFFTIVSGDGMDMFDISTDKDTQDGVISVSKPLDFEKKPSYTVEIQVQNTQVDPRFIGGLQRHGHDVDEPPLFYKASYLMEVKEDASVGVAVGSVTPPLASLSPHSPLTSLCPSHRYSIDRHTDMDRLFNVHPGNGSVFLLRTLDREESAWHNISLMLYQRVELEQGVYSPCVCPSDNPRQSSHVPVYIRLLDINDNAPTFATIYETFVCERTKAGQVLMLYHFYSSDCMYNGIQQLSTKPKQGPFNHHHFFQTRIQTVSAVDADEPSTGHKFFFSLAPEGTHRSNFTVRDNGGTSALLDFLPPVFVLAGCCALHVCSNHFSLSCSDNTAGILTRRASYSRLHQSVYLVPVVITDGDYPMQSSTGTLTVRVCTCDREGNMELCNAEALSSSPGLSTGALIAILLCAIILLMIVVLFTALKRQRKQEPLIISKEDVRDNVVSYNDEGGGEEDTQAFDIGALRHPDTAAALEESAKQRRDIIPTDTLLYPPHRLTAPATSGLIMPPVSMASRDNGDVCEFINQRVLENDCNPTAPPYDSLATYAYEGAGSVAESLSSLGSASSEGEQDYTT
ncbi:hypothetical protein F7725_012021 [Dissostichus mawsoni]|uniref:Cadherin domain-containing protein n=1 Tax=Dissostichus mawsoni TaxID=36200 RepID=A0A7J5ZB77_DISMA|nr:hypothetical protein F7725_012021 [Dissostichus mawsoni]